MILRELRPEDLEKLNAINGYENQIDIALDANTLSGAIVEDNKGRIISGGIIRSISEVVLVTDKNVNSISRIKAINELIQYGEYVSKKSGRNEIHAFVTDKRFEDFLIKLGFRESNGKCLVRTF